MRIKQLIACVLSVFILSPAKYSHAENISINVSFAPARLESTYRHIVDAFMKENPDIKISLRGTPTYVDLLQQNLRSAVIGDLPDISFEGLNFVRLYAERGLAVPLEDLLSNDSQWKGSGYDVDALNSGRIANKLYAIPFAVSTPVLFFNTTLVGEAGGDPADLPKDWDGIMNLARRISALPGGKQGFNFDWNSGATLGFQTLLFGEGGRMMNDSETDVVFDNVAGERAMELLRSFGEAGQIDESRESTRQAFASGVLGIYSTSSSILASFLEQTRGRFVIRMAPFPVAGTGARYPASGNAMVIFTRDQARQAASWKFAKFATSAEAQTIMAIETGYVPLNKRAVESPNLLGGFYDKNPEYLTAVKQVDLLTNWYMFPGPNSSRIADELTEAMRRVLTLKQLPKEALADVADKTRVLLRPKRN